MNAAPVLPTSAATLAPRARCVTPLSVTLPWYLVATPVDLAGCSGVDNFIELIGRRGRVRRISGHVRY